MYGSQYIKKEERNKGNLLTPHRKKIYMMIIDEKTFFLREFTKYNDVKSL